MFLRVSMVVAVLASLVVLPAKSFAFCYEQAGAMYGIPPDLLMAISKVESSYDPQAINRSNKNGTYDYGLMQINSFWAPVIGTERWNALGDPCYNTIVGAWVLSNCFKDHGRGVEGIGCYNVGPGKGKRRDKLRKKYADKVLAVYNQILSTKRIVNEEQKESEIKSSDGWESGGM